jgi:hypothetical protein
MKLLTHNFLACNVKGVKNGYPLIIEAEKVEVREFDMDPGVFFLDSSVSFLSIVRLRHRTQRFK